MAQEKWIGVEKGHARRESLRLHEVEIRDSLDRQVKKSCAQLINQPGRGRQGTAEFTILLVERTMIC
jgi:hypothetical protein